MISRRLPIGAELTNEGVSFRIWAPNCQKLSIISRGRDGKDCASELKMDRQPDGYFNALSTDIKVGDLYKFKADEDEWLYPDPASRFQPDGPHGHSQVVDHSTFRWTDDQWEGIELPGQVFYEMHIGTFTREGTYAAAAAELEELRSIGITTIEVMPLADFPGRFGWGYDGVNVFAPTRLYGKPDDLRAFINKAHNLGMGVILDVVYNHLGADGNYVQRFAKDYFSQSYINEWGDAINFDAENSGPVREFFITNAGYWVEEFHFDGLRLDATQQIFDASKINVMTEITDRVALAAKGRSTLVVGENEPQDIKLITPKESGGYGLHCLWNDDFHHSAMVALTGKNEAYYLDYQGAPQELISATKYGYLFQGQWSEWKKERRGTASLAVKPKAMVTFIQNHDQIANSGKGLRVDKLTTPGRYKAITALMLLAPGTPLLFQGQEFAASTPFNYFADHAGELAEQVADGRRKSLSFFRSMDTDEARSSMLIPHDESTFNACKLNFEDRERNRALYDMTKFLLQLRRNDNVFSHQDGKIDGAVLAPEAFLLRFFGDNGDDRLLLVNLGKDLLLGPCPEPLTAPPANGIWQEVFSTEEQRFGGGGPPRTYDNERLYVTAHSAIVLKSAITQTG